MRKLSRSIYNSVISNTKDMKALAFLLFVKHNTPCSVIPNYSYYKLSKLTSLHKNTVKNRIETLSSLGLISLDGKNSTHLRFNSVRAKYNSQNVDISALDYTSIKTIELGLQALFIVEVQRKKNFIKQLFEAEKNPKNLKKFKAIKTKSQLRGERKFKDNGISYNYISSKLNINARKVSEILSYGEKADFFKKHKNIQKISIHNEYGRINYGYRNLVMLGSYALIVSASTFELTNYALPLITISKMP